MDPEVMKTMLESIATAISSNRRANDIALPVFHPEKSNNGAEAWCKSVEDLAVEFHWSGLQMVALAGKALRGSASIWFDSWEPPQRDWETFKDNISALFPAKRNLSEKLTKAVLYSSDSAETYTEYAREKILLLRQTNVSFTEEQLIELVCGSIRDINVRMGALNSFVTSTSELMTLLSCYSKNPRKRFFIIP